MINLLFILILVCLAGFFDSIMDMIKDYPYSNKNWLNNWVYDKHREYQNWYIGHHSLPFFEKKGWTYNPGLVWLSDAWHMAKHFMLLSWAGALTIGFDTHWYFQLVIFWLAYFIEGELFNLFYNKVKS